MKNPGCWDAEIMVRDQLTDFYFSHHLSFELLKRLIADVLPERGITSRKPYEFNPEVLPGIAVNQGGLMRNRSC